MESTAPAQVGPTKPLPPPAAEATVEEEASADTSDGTTVTVPHEVVATATQPHGVSPAQRSGHTRNMQPGADGRGASATRNYTDQQLEILRRGRLAGKGDHSPGANPLAGGDRRECLDIHGNPKRLQATATVRRVKREDSQPEKKLLFPSWLAKLLLIVGQVIIAALLIAGVAMPLFKTRDTAEPARCYNYWGRVKCGTYQYAIRGQSAWQCSARANTVRTSLVFAVLDLAFSVIIIAAMLLKYFFKTRALNATILILSFLNCLFLMLAFALIAVVYNVPACDQRSPSSLVSYGPTLPLFLVAWVLTIVYVVLLFFILP